MQRRVSAVEVHPEVTQRILRHARIAMTREVYAEASEEEVRAAIGRLYGTTKPPPG